MRRIKIFDTTLRDGEQSPGIALQPHEKAEIARALEPLGVDVIEAGFAASSPGDHAGVAAVAVRRLDARPSRRSPDDRRPTSTPRVDALAGRRRSRLHVFIATSALHMERKLGLDAGAGARADRVGGRLRARARRRGRVLGRGRDALGPRVPRSGLPRRRSRPAPTSSTFRTPSATRCPTSSRGSSTTCGRSAPSSTSVELSVHCHDDLGLAVANSLAGVAAGATQVECTVNGIGERAGNAALEEIVDGACASAPSRFGAESGRRHAPAAPRRRALVVRADGLRRAAQQGDRRRERVRARGGHPPGRHAQGRVDVPDHRSGRARR